MNFSGLIPELQEAGRYLDRVVHDSGLQGRVTSTVRTRGDQEKLYRKYLAGQSQFPATPPGQSAHEYGWAFDYVVSPYEYQTDVGLFWRDQMGGVWTPKDVVHFEYPGFAPPPTVDSIRDTPFFVDLLDFASSFIPGVGEIELGEMVAQWIDPIPDSKNTLEAKISRFLRSPIGSMYLAWKNS